MTKDNKQQELSDSTDTAIAYSTCYPQFFSGDIQIYNGNNIEVLQSLNLNLSKCIFVSDPPFNIGYHYDQYNDRMNEDDYYNWLADVFGTNKQVIIHYPEYLYKHAFNIGLFPEKVVSWVYNSNTGKQHRDIAFFGVKPDFRKVGQDYKNPTDKRISKRIAEGKTARLYDWWEINQVKNVSAEKTAHPSKDSHALCEFDSFTTRWTEFENPKAKDALIFETSNKAFDALEEIGAGKVIKITLES